MTWTRPLTSSRQPPVLVVDDEVRSQRLLRITLEPLGYRVVALPSASNGADLVEQHHPELIVLDLDLPDPNGFELCRQVRTVSDVPIIIVSASGQSADKVRGLELGADDYVTKPYDPAELAARMNAVLRRVKGQPAPPPSLFKSGELRIDFAQCQVTLAGREVKLTGTEYRLLERLAQHAGRTLVMDALLAHVWGDEYTGEYAQVHLYISRLRKKLGETARQPRWILTKGSVGYQMVAADAPSSEADLGRRHLPPPTGRGAY